MLQGWGLEGWGLDLLIQANPRMSPEKGLLPAFSGLPRSCSGPLENQELSGDQHFLKLGWNRNRQPGMGTKKVFFRRNAS